MSSMMHNPFKKKSISWSLVRRARLVCHRFPGLWMGADQRRQLQADLESILLRRLQEIPRYGLFAPEGDALSQRYVSIIYGADGTPLAFGTVKPVLAQDAGRPVRTALLGLAAVDAQIESPLPLFSLFFASLPWMFVGGGCRRFAVAACTMHPALVELITRQLSDVYPDYRRHGQPSQAQLAVARHLLEHHGLDVGYEQGSNFEADGFVLRNTYSGACAALRRDFDGLRQAGDQRCNVYCQATLDYVRGDDLMLIGWVDWSALCRNLPLALRRSAR